MGKMISRAAAAKLLGCSEQTVTNYAERGLIDCAYREQKGRTGYFFDEDQVVALAPKLRCIAELDEAIAQEKEKLLEEQKELSKAREKAREDFLKINGGKRTYYHIVELVAGAYAFVDKLTPGTRSQYEADILSRFLAMQTMEEIMKATKSSKYKVEKAVDAIARRMLKIPTLTQEYNRIKKENEKLVKEKELLRKENESLRELRVFREQSERVVIQKIKAGEQVAETPVLPKPHLKSYTVDEMGFTSHVVKSLKNAGIFTLYDIIQYTERELSDLKGISVERADEIARYVSSLGLSLKKTGV